MKVKGLKQKIKKATEVAETTGVLGGSIILGYYTAWPVGVIVAGLWYMKRRWKKGNRNK